MSENDPTRLGVIGNLIILIGCLVLIVWTGVEHMRLFIIFLPILLFLASMILIVEYRSRKRQKNK